MFVPCSNVAPQLRRRPLGGTKMTARRPFPVAIACVLVAACAHGQSPLHVEPLPTIHLPESGSPQWNASLRHVRDSLVALAPDQEAERAVGRRDCHLLGVTGYTLMVPGLPYRNLPSYAYGVYVFPATTDAPVGKEQGDYQSTAIYYATLYNRAILQRLADCGCPK